MFVGIKKIVTMVGLGALFALAAGCASKTAEVKAPEAPAASSEEMSLLGIGAEAPATQVPADEGPAKAKKSGADDGSDIIPPFSSKAPAKKKAAHKPRKKKK